MRCQLGCIPYGQPRRYVCDHYARTVLVEPYFAVGPWLDGQRYLHRASTEFILIDRWQPDHLIAPVAEMVQQCPRHLPSDLCLRQDRRFVTLALPDLIAYEPLPPEEVRDCIDDLAHGRESVHGRDLRGESDMTARTRAGYGDLANTVRPTDRDVVPHRRCCSKIAVPREGLHAVPTSGDAKPALLWLTQ